MTFEQLMQEPQHLLLKCISGSRAYNLALPSSDTDIKGVFVPPQKSFYGLNYVPQVANARNDEVFFEIGRLIELVVRNNPNILELDPAGGFPLPAVHGYLRRLCQNAEKERKSVLDFCYVVEGNGTVPLQAWLAANHLSQENCGLVGLTHFRDAYLLYHGAEPSFRGIVSDPSANDVQLSSIPKGHPSLGVMHFNKDGYSSYCREYKEYWNYRRVIVHREDRNFLLSIRAAEFAFEDLMIRVEEKLGEIERLYGVSDLPEAPDAGRAEEQAVRQFFCFILTRNGLLLVHLSSSDSSSPMIIFFSRIQSTGAFLPK